MRKSIALLMSWSAVSACGGSGGSTDQPVEQPVSFDATALRVFADGSGAARYSGQSEGESGTGYFLSPELALMIEELESTGEVDPYDVESLTTVDTGPNTTIRTGTVTEDGVIVNIVAAVTTDEDAALAYIEEPSSGLSLLMSGGDDVANMPTGSASYAGVLGLQDIVYDAEPELGTFTATANFSGDPSITLNGATSSYTVDGTASISGNRFASSSVSIGGNGFTAPATLNGDFHGDGANSVAGVIYSNDDFAEIRGGFVGSQ